MRWLYFFFVQAEDGIRDLVRSRGLGDVYKRQAVRRSGGRSLMVVGGDTRRSTGMLEAAAVAGITSVSYTHLTLPTIYSV